jgi:hypothetical protein
MELCMITSLKSGHDKSILLDQTSRIEKPTTSLTSSQGVLGWDTGSLHLMTKDHSYRLFTHTNCATAQRTKLVLKKFAMCFSNCHDMKLTSIHTYTRTCAQYRLHIHIWIVSPVSECDKSVLLAETFVTQRHLYMFAITVEGGPRK